MGSELLIAVGITVPILSLFGILVWLGNRPGKLSAEEDRQARLRAMVLTLMIMERVDRERVRTLFRKWKA